LWIGTGLESGFSERGSWERVYLEFATWAPLGVANAHSTPLSDIRIRDFGSALRVDFGEMVTEGLGQFLNFESAQKIFVTTPLSLPRHF
jgi:hypothetical protein